MSELITLKYFNADKRHYHLYRIQKSPVSHRPHHHDYFQVCFVLSGELLHKQEGESVKLCPGDAFIVPPGFIHSLHFEGNHSEIYSLSFEDRLFHTGFPHSNAYHFLRELRSNVRSPHQNSVRLRVALDDEQFKSIHALMECLARQQKAVCPTDLSAAPSLVAAIVYLLSQNYYSHPQTDAQLPEPKSYTSVLLQCKEYIDTHYNQPLSLESLTKQFGLSRSSFCAAFPQFAGMPLQKYIAHQRITQAQTLIRSQPELTLTQIAGMVGYEDNSTFYRNFLRVTGIPPSQYKEHCTKQKVP